MSLKIIFYLGFGILIAGSVSADPVLEVATLDQVKQAKEGIVAYKTGYKGLSPDEMEVLLSLEKATLDLEHYLQGKSVESSIDIIADNYCEAAIALDAFASPFGPVEREIILGPQYYWLAGVLGENLEKLTAYKGKCLEARDSLDY